jgi:hypothetical protein
MFSKLLFINGLFTAIGGFIFIFFPNQLMQVFGIQLLQKGFFIYYLLGVTSLSFSVLSFSAIKLNDRASIRAIGLTFLIFHAAEAVVGVYEFTKGINSLVWITVVVHAVFSFLFWVFGVYKNLNKHLSSNNV